MNLTIAEDGKQGLWSSGYSNNDKTSFTSSAKWILYRDIDGNSYFKGSATSLETARSLWGNSFNGTADINGTIKLGDEKEIQFLINRKNTSQTTGWAKPFIKFFGQNETDPFAVMGIFGSKNTLNYIYIGTYNYDGNNLRIKADGSIEVPKDTDSTSTTTGAIVTGGGIGVTKSIKVGTQIKFTSTNALKHIEFSRTSGGPSYICYPSNGQLAIGFNTGYDNSIAIFDTNTALRPGKTSTYTLGNSSYRWNDIFSVGGNYSGTITALNLRLTSTTDASGTADNGPALIIGSRTGQHLEIDTNEIMSKKTGTTVDTLYLNANGGVIQLNNASDSYYTKILSTKDGSASEGALRVDGGVSIAKKLHVGKTIIGHGGIIYIKSSKSPWPDIQFDTEAGISAEDKYHYTYETVATDGWCQLFAQVPAKRTLTTDNSTLYYGSRFFFRVYSKQANTLTRLNFYEDYYLPTVNDDRTNNKSYNILTEKSTVTVAQGGTGNTSYTANTLVYAESASKLSSRTALTVGTNQLTLTGPAGADTAIKVTGSQNSISLMIGSGNVNRGIYDHTNNKWMIYADANNQIIINSNSYINGKLTLLPNQYDGPDGNIGLDAANSDIIRVNGIYTSDKAELFSEGYLAYRSDTTWDAMAAKDGVFYFGSNVARDAALAGSATLEAGEIISRKASGEGMVIAANSGNHKLYLYCNSDGRSGIYGYTTNGTGYTVFATAAGATSSTFYGNVTGSSASCTGNSATATRIYGNLAAATNNTNCNIWISDGTPTGVPRYGSGFYYNPSSKTLTVPGPITAQYAGSLSITINNSTQDHSIQLTSNAAGTVGLYDVTKSKWMLYNTASNGLVLGTIDGADITTSGYNMTTKCTTTDLKATNNGGSNEQRGFFISDKNGNGSIRLINIAHTNGYNYMYLQVRAFDGNTDRGYQGLTIAALKNGTISTSLVGSFSNTGVIQTNGGSSPIYHEVYNNYGDLYLYQHNSNNAGLYRNNYWNGSAKTASSGWLITTRTDGQVTSSFKIYGAVWNDYAEYRATEPTEPGRVVTETYDKLIITKERLMPGCRIVSDTFGFAIGQTELYNTPIAVSGRVLVYPYRSREEYPLGAAVCSAPNGTVDIMTHDEIMMYPERIVGTVSEIPTYEIWQAGSKESPNPIQVNGRIWIYVR